MKKGRGKSKGNDYERFICKQLSLWWTQDLDEPRDDVFWRSTTSGGRATTRSKQGKQTAGQYGDVAALDPIGKPLLDFMVIELKRGYKGTSLHDLLDCIESNKEQEIEKWVKQAETAAEAADAKGWAIIHARNRRKDLIYMDESVWNWLNTSNPAFYTHAHLWNVERNIDLHVLTFEEWMERFHPDQISGNATTKLQETKK